MNSDYKKCRTCGQLMGFDTHVCHTVPIRERFWKHVFKTESCWLWTGSKNEDGYGKIFRELGFSPLRAHRVSWEIHHGLIPAGMLVLHRCDNPPCVRPDHLFLGTARDNTADMIAKNRQGGVCWNQSPS